MYESRTQKPLPRAQFVARVLRHFATALFIVVASLGIGMAGYHYIEGLPWLDAFLNSAMLLGGMGPVDNPRSSGGKLFAGLYALYSGLVFLITVGVVLVPILHRALHRFHWRTEGEK